MAESAVKKFLVRNAFMVAFMGLFFTFLIVVTVLGAFTFVSIRAGNARIEASIAASMAESRAERRADIDGLRAEWKAGMDKLKAAIDGLPTEWKDGMEGLSAEWRTDIDMLLNKIDDIDDNLGARLDESERERARTQGAIDVLRGLQAPNP